MRTRRAIRRRAALRNNRRRQRRRRHAQLFLAALVLGVLSAAAGVQAQEAGPEEPVISLAAGAQSFITRGTDREFWTGRATVREPFLTRGLAAGRCELTATQDPRASLLNPTRAAGLFRSIECALTVGWRLNDALRVSSVGGTSFSVEGAYQGRPAGPLDPRLYTFGLGVSADFKETGGGHLYLGHYGPGCAPEEVPQPDAPVPQKFCPAALLDVAYPSGVPKTNVVLSVRVPFAVGLLDKRLYQIQIGAVSTFWSKRRAQPTRPPAVVP